MKQTNQTTGSATPEEMQKIMFNGVATKCKKSYREFTELRDGAGTTKSYEYFYANIRLRTKEDVAQGLRLKLKVCRKDKFMGTIEQYDHKTQRFEKVKWDIKSQQYKKVN